MRFTSVDLPTFGRPTTASTGTGPDAVLDSVGAQSLVEPDGMGPGRPRLVALFDQVRCSRMCSRICSLTSPIISVVRGHGMAGKLDRLAVDDVDARPSGRA